MESEYITLKDLVEVKHPYYCSDTNFYSNDASGHWDTMTEWSLPRFLSFKEHEVHRFVQFLKPHWKTLGMLWNPFSGVKNEK